MRKGWAPRSFCVSDEHYVPTLLASLGLDSETDCMVRLTAHAPQPLRQSWAQVWSIELGEGHELDLRLPSRLPWCRLSPGALLCSEMCGNFNRQC